MSDLIDDNNLNSVIADTKYNNNVTSLLVVVVVGATNPTIKRNITAYTV